MNIKVERISEIQKGRAKSRKWSDLSPALERD